ncbi:MAG: hypothetical protein K8H88_27235 [Sandaracinaceae bacterium]|nr:hypothetical protein [Sandaracinaceae bacterium]
MSPKTDFDFSGLQAGASVGSLPLAQNLNVSRWGGGTLMVRVHEATLQSGSYFRIDAYVVAPTDEQPDALFRERTVATVVGHQASVSVPSLLHCRLAAAMGAHISLYLTVNQAKLGACTFTISVDLLLEERVDDWTPAELGSKLTLWIDQRDLVLVSGAYSDWGDQSPAANDFTQGTSSLRPMFGQTVNFFPAPDFDGTDDYLQSNLLSNLVSASAYHVFVVLRADMATGSNPTAYLNHGVIADTNAGWWGLYLTTAGGSDVMVHGFHWAGGLREAIAGGLTTGDDALVEWSYDGTTIRCQVARYAVATGSGGGSIGSLTNAVRLGTGATGGLFFDGRIVAVVVCNTHLTAGEVRSVRDYLSSKYGVIA